MAKFIGIKCCERDRALATLETMRSTVAAEEAVRAATAAEFDRIRAERDALLASTSWRLTAPLRATIEAFKRLRTRRAA